MKMIWLQLKADTMHTSGYVEYDKRIVAGVKVQLKEDPTWWLVESVGEPIERTPLNSEKWYQTNFVRKDGKWASSAWQKNK